MGKLWLYHNLVYQILLYQSPLLCYIIFCYICFRYVTFHFLVISDSVISISVITDSSSMLYHFPLYLILLYQVLLYVIPTWLYQIRYIWFRYIKIRYIKFTAAVPSARSLTARQEDLVGICDRQKPVGEGVNKLNFINQCFFGISDGQLQCNDAFKFFLFCAMKLRKRTLKTLNFPLEVPFSCNSRFLYTLIFQTLITFEQTKFQLRRPDVRRRVRPVGAAYGTRSLRE